MKKVFHSESNDLAIYQLGSRIVNWYLLDSQDGVVIIDTGFSGHWQQLVDALAHLGRTYDQVLAVLLTHAHIDHTGFAERARQRTSADIYIHTIDAKAVRYDHGDMPSELTDNLWRPKTFFAFASAALRQGAFGAKPVAEVNTFEDDDVLDLPSRPQVILTPGHTIGHCAFYLPEEKILFSGDAICTRSPVTLQDHPPHVMEAGDDKKLALTSLEKFSSLGEILLLPGHGASWKGDAHNAVQNAQKMGPLL
ncbi:MAG: MBL fold metallo-hydrolase [Chloroflexota bacterium]